MRRLKIVYAGPGLAGKTLNLWVVHAALSGRGAGPLTSLATESSRTLFFEADLPCVNGAIPIVLATVAGAVFYNESRVESLREVDAVVFVADSQIERVEANREEARRLLSNLRKVGRTSVPIVLQANKQDLPGVLDVTSMEPWLACLDPVAAVDASALDRTGVLESLRSAVDAVSERASQIRWSDLDTRDGASSKSPERVHQIDLSDDADVGRVFRGLRDGTKPRRLRIRGARAIPAEIGEVRSLELLDLDGAELATLPAEIGSLESLRTLRLRDNALTCLPPEVGRLRALNQLWLAGNNLERLPEEIAGLHALQFLSLDGNPRLERLPERMQSLPLRALLMRSVPLTSLPDALGAISSLELVSMSGTRFVAPPAVLGRMLGVRHLELRGNRPALDAAELFRTLATRQLSFLDVSDCGLATLPPEVTGLTNLWTLDLSGNPIRTLPPELRQMERLSEITLEIEALDSDVQRSLDSYLPRYRNAPNALWTRERDPRGSTTLRREQ